MKGAGWQPSWQDRQKQGYGDGDGGCGQWGLKSEGAGGTEQVSTQLMAGQPWAWATVPTRTDHERTHHQARGPPRALDAFQANVSRGALWEAEEGLSMSGWPLGRGSSSSMTPGGWPHFALPVKRGSRESNKCPQLPTCRNQRVWSMRHGISLHSDFRVRTLYGYHTHFTADKTEAWRYKVTCLMHRAGKLSQA